MAVGGLTIGQGRGNRITTNRLHPLRQGNRTHTMTTLALSLCIVLAIAAGILANSLRNRDKELDAMAESYNSLRDELTQTQTQRAKAIQEREQADRLRDECEKTMRAAMEENDRMMTERANLYFRNSKGQIAKLHP
jgi:uncharacterized protein YlxW (UPF0749 family)